MVLLLMLFTSLTARLSSMMGSGSAPAASASVKSISFDVNLNRDTDNAYAIGMLRHTGVRHLHSAEKSVEPSSSTRFCTATKA